MPVKDPNNVYLDPEYWANKGIRDARDNCPTSSMHEPTSWVHVENQQVYVKAYRKESMRLLLNRNKI